MKDDGDRRETMNVYDLDETLDWLESMELDEESLRDNIEAIVEDEDINRLMNNVAWANSNDKALKNAAKVQKEKLTDKIRSAEKRIERRNEIAFKVLSRLKDYKLKTEEYSFWVQKNPIKIEYDEQVIPDEYFKMVRELDKDAIKKALNDGIEISGVSQTQTEGIRIR